jgi:hypothetical protein
MGILQHGDSPNLLLDAHQVKTIEKVDNLFLERYILFPFLDKDPE